MTIGELLAAFPSDSEIQINVITAPGSLTFIPTPAFFTEHSHWKTMQELGSTPVRTLNISVEQVGDQHFLLLIINEEVQNEQDMQL